MEKAKRGSENEGKYEIWKKVFFASHQNLYGRVMCWLWDSEWK
jgi:hypothetical protein